MNKFYILAGAVAAALGTQCAQALTVADTLAAPVKLVVSGASAQRDNFRDRLNLDLCVSGTFDIYSADDGDANTSEDFKAFSCTLKATADAPDLDTNVQNQNAVVYYRSEGGSVYGVGPLIGTAPANATFATGVSRLVVDSNCANPTVQGQGTTAHNCPITGYSLTTDTDTTIPSRLTTDPTQVGVTDVEPSLFRKLNWPVAGTSVLGTVPSDAQLNSLAGTATVASGTLFGVIVSNNGVTSGLTNLSKTEIAAIFSGGLTDWVNVLNPDTKAAVAGSSTSIKLCRREPGSGTQVATAIYFHDYLCNASAPTFLTDNGSTVIENGTSTLEGTCVANGTTGNAIGFAGFGSAPANTHFIAIDGVAPVRQDAALLKYGFVFESTIQKRTGLAATVVPNSMATALINTSRRQAGQSTSLTSSSIALPIATVNTASLANATSTKPVALGLRNKNSCKPPVRTVL
jgi:hypothetical protein